MWNQPEGKSIGIVVTHNSRTKCQRLGAFQVRRALSIPWARHAQPNGPGSSGAHVLTLAWNYQSGSFPRSNFILREASFSLGMLHVGFLDITASRLPAASLNRIIIWANGHAYTTFSVLEAE